MYDKSFFSIEPLKPVSPASRPLPLGRGPAGGAFSGSLGQALSPENIAAASELVLNQGLLDILGDGEAGEGGGGGGGGAMNTLLLTSLLGGGGQASLTAGLPADLAQLAAGFPGGSEALISALRQATAAQAPAAGAAAFLPAPIPAPTLPAALAPAAALEGADGAPGLARNAGLRAYARAARPQDPGQAAAPSSLARPVASPRPDPFSNLLGRLAARFESGGDPAAVGYDRVGGTSYGIYQLSSRAGTMDEFLGFLEARRPEWAARLDAAGPANTGSASGKMPVAWRAIAAQDRDGFARLQHEFIGRHHFLPAAERIQATTGLDLAGNPALAEVLWSTAVQHGPTGAADIVSRAAEAVGPTQSPGFAANLVGEIYKRRAGRFGSSDAPVQEAVRSRLERERETALSLLRVGGTLDSEV